MIAGLSARALRPREAVAWPLSGGGLARSNSGLQAPEGGDLILAIGLEICDDFKN
jgi:hypothetical protein